MKRCLIPLLALLMVILQTTVMPYLAIGEAAPDLVFLLVVFLAVQRSSTLGIWTAFGAGLLQDIAAGSPLGLNAVLLTSLAYLAGQVHRKLFKDNVSAQVLIVVLFTWLHQFLVFFWLNTVMATSFGLGKWILRAFGMSIFHAVLAPGLFYWWRRWIRGENIYRYLITGRKDQGARWSRLRRIG